MEQEQEAVGDSQETADHPAPRSVLDRGGRREDMEAKGNIVDHEYKIERGGERVAEVSKRWFRIRDTYGIEIAPGQEEALLLAVTVCIDQMARG